MMTAMRWIRRLLLAVKGVLLIVCLAILVLWVRSYWRGDWIDRATYIDVDNGAVFDSRFVASNNGWLRVGSQWYWCNDETAVDLRKRFAAKPVMRIGGHHLRIPSMPTSWEVPPLPPDGDR